MKRNDGAWIGLASTFRTRPTVKQVWTPQFDPDLLDPTGWKKILCRESDLILRRPSCFFLCGFCFAVTPDDVPKETRKLPRAIGTVVHSLGIGEPISLAAATCQKCGAITRKRISLKPRRRRIGSVF